MIPERDEDNYPTEATLQVIEDWTGSISELLDFIKAAWCYEDFASYKLQPAEAEICDAEPGERYLRLATGGWSGNEEIIAAFRRNYMAHGVTWELSARGGLHVYRYPNPDWIMLPS